MDFRRIIAMRNLLLAGTAGLLLSVGAAGAANAANPNVPGWSPYSIMAYDAPPPPPPMYHPGRRMSEARAAYVTQTSPDRPIFNDGSSDGDHRYMSDGNRDYSDVPGGQSSGAPDSMGDR
jgi:hypothetical protein